MNSIDIRAKSGNKSMVVISQGWNLKKFPGPKVLVIFEFYMLHICSSVVKENPKIRNSKGMEFCGLRQIKELVCGEKK